MRSLASPVAAVVLGSTVAASDAVAASAPGRLVVRRAALGPGRTTGVLRAPHRFDLVGAPVSLVDGIVSSALGGDSVMATPPDGVAMGLVYCLVAAVLVVGCYAALLVRYRKALA